MTFKLIHRVCIGLVVTAVCLGPVPSTAQGRPRRVTFRSNVDVPTEGLRIALPQGAQPVGADSQEVFHYRDSAGRMVEMQCPRALWISSQYLRSWQDQRGGRFALAVPRTLLPETWPRPHVLPEEFRAGMDGASVPVHSEDLDAWTVSYAGEGLAGPPRDLQAGVNVRTARLYIFEGNTPQRRGVAFRMRPNAFGIDPDRWFFLLLEFNPAVDGTALDQALGQALIPGIRAVARPSHSDRDEPEHSDLHALSRRRALETIRGLSGWRHVDTPHYVLLTDLAGSRALAIRRIEQDVEPLRKIFEAMIPPMMPVEAVSIIRIFADSEEYQAMVGPEMAWSSGAWLPRLDEMVIRTQEWGSPRERRAWLVETVYHEAFHQYLHYALDGREPGVWYNEGHATFFEGAEIRDGQVTLDEVPRYAERLDALVAEQRLHLEQLLNMSYDAFYATGSNQRQDNYARAWGLVYYLRRHAEAAPGHAWADLLERYRLAFARYHDDARARAEAFGPRSVADLERDLAVFWNTVPSRRAARRNPLFRTESNP